MTQVASSPGIRWWRWVLAALATFVLLLCCIYVLWSSTATSHVRKRIAALQAAGEPILPEDFVVRGIDVPENASPDIIAALALLPTDSEARKQLSKFSLGLPLREDEISVITAVLSESSAALQRFDAGRGKTMVRWDSTMTSPVMVQLLPELTPARSMANLLWASAFLEHQKGNDAEALRRIDQILLLSRHVDVRPILVSHLVSVGIIGLAGNVVVEMAPDLRIGVGPQDASPEQVRALIDTLLESKTTEDGLRMALRGERMVMYDTTRVILSGSIRSPALPELPRLPAPLVNRGTVLMLDYVTAIIATVNEPNLPSARQKSPHLPSRTILNSYANMMSPALDRVIESHFKGMTERRLTATALALRWYAIDHDGRLPQTLEELVPKYLPAVPLDAMAAEQRPIGYRADGGGIVYSVGMDGKDDGGSTVPLPNRRLGSTPGPWELPDRVIYLTRQPRPVPEKDDEAEDAAASLDATPSTNPSSRAAP